MSYEPFDHVRFCSNGWWSLCFSLCFLISSWLPFSKIYSKLKKFAKPFPKIFHALFTPPKIFENMFPLPPLLDFVVSHHTSTPTHWLFCFSVTTDGSYTGSSFSSLCTEVTHALDFICFGNFKFWVAWLAITLLLLTPPCEPSREVLGYRQLILRHLGFSRFNLGFLLDQGICRVYHL